jgi:hypothetical protein
LRQVICHSLALKRKPNRDRRRRRRRTATADETRQMYCLPTASRKLRRSPASPSIRQIPICKRLDEPTRLGAGTSAQTPNHLCRKRCVGSALRTPLCSFRALKNLRGHIDPSAEALFANLRRSPPPLKLDARCQIHRRTPPPRPNWRRQTTLPCPAKGGFGAQSNGGPAVSLSAPSGRV